MAYLLGRYVELESAAQRGAFLRVAAHKKAGSVDLCLPGSRVTDFDAAYTLWSVCAANTGQEGVFSFQSPATKGFLRLDVVSDRSKPALYLSMDDGTFEFKKETVWRILPSLTGDEGLVTLEPLTLPGLYVHCPAPGSGSPESRLASTEATTCGGTPVLLSKASGRVGFSAEASFDLRVLPPRLALETLPAPPVDTPLDLECLGLRSAQPNKTAASHPSGDFLACEPFRPAASDAPTMRLATKMNRNEARCTRLKVVPAPTGTPGYFGLACALHPGRVAKVDKTANRFRVVLVRKSDIPAGREGEASFRLVRALNGGALAAAGNAALKAQQADERLLASVKAKAAPAETSGEGPVFVSLAQLETSSSSSSTEPAATDADVAAPVLVDLSALTGDASTPTAATTSSVTAPSRSPTAASASAVAAADAATPATESIAAEGTEQEDEDEEVIAGSASSSSSDYGCVSIECEALPGNFLRAMQVTSPAGYPTTAIFLHHYREAATVAAGAPMKKRGRHAEASFFLRTFPLGADIDCEPGIPSGVVERAAEQEDDDDGEEGVIAAPAAAAKAQASPAPAKKSCFKRYFCCCLAVDGSAKK